jgi:hypothetical protein
MKTWLDKALEDPIAFFTAITAIGTIVLAVSTIFLWIVTRKVALAAKASAEALTTIERAQLFVEIASAGFYSKDGKGDEIHAEVKLWNYGKTPAIVKMIRGYIVFADSPPTTLMDFPGADRQLPPGLGIASNVVFPLDVSKKWTEADREAVMRLNTTAFCVGLVQYSDVMGMGHETAYCWQYVPAGNRFEISRSGNLNFRT